MTSLVAWIAVDQRSASAVYIATDSRISWDGTQAVRAHNWDRGRKTFASERTSEIFGYVGDVLFPALALPTITTPLGRGPAGSVNTGMPGAISDVVRGAWSEVPQEERRETYLVHCSRVGENVQWQFGAQIMHISNGALDWSTTFLTLPEHSARLEFLGSGASGLKATHARWVPIGKADHARSRTSRAVFSSFCDALHDKEDPKSGGAPQLVGLYRKGPGRTFGISWNSQTYIAGSQANSLVTSNIEYRNQLFERVDAGGKLIQGAQRHAGRPT